MRQNEQSSLRPDRQRVTCLPSLPKCLLVAAPATNHIRTNHHRNSHKDQHLAKESTSNTRVSMLRLTWVEATPSWPYAFPPQHLTLPSSNTAQQCSSPHDTVAAVRFVPRSTRGKLSPISFSASPTQTRRQGMMNRRNDITPKGCKGATKYDAVWSGHLECGCLRSRVARRN